MLIESFKYNLDDHQFLHGEAVREHHVKPALRAQTSITALLLDQNTLGMPVWSLTWGAEGFVLMAKSAGFISPLILKAY